MKIGSLFSVFCLLFFPFLLSGCVEPIYQGLNGFYAVEITNASDSNMTVDLYIRTDRQAIDIEEVKASLHERQLTIERKQTVRLPFYVTVASITAPIGPASELVSAVFHAETKENLFAYVCVNSEKSFSVGERVLSYIIGEQEKYRETEIVLHSVFAEGQIIPTDERPPRFIFCGLGDRHSRLAIVRLSLKNASEVCE